MKRTSGKAALGCSVCLVALALATGAWAQQRSFEIPAQEANKAVPEFARQAGLRIVAPGGQLRNVRTNAVSGQLDTRAALAAMLKGTGLVVATDDGTLITLRKAPVLPQLDAAADPASDEPERVSEIVVTTGTRIRGASPAAPVRRISRTDIERSGYSQVGDIMRSLPENFGGGQNPGVLGTANNGDNMNVTGASTMNLRGLGPGATLVLLNGRRIAGDAVLQAPDISAIPLAALQQVEVVTDGASGIYGSDAIAGVANFILRRDYDGVEVSARLGDSTQGGGFEQTYSVLGGVTGQRSHALISAEYSSQKSILASERPYTSGAQPENRLIPASARSALYLGLGTDLTDRLSISFDGLVSTRQLSNVIKYRPSSRRIVSKVESPAQNYALGAMFKLSDTWDVRLDGVYSKTSNKRYTGLATSSSTSRYGNSTQYVEASADGTALRLPSGEVRAAIGAGYREEDFRDTASGTHGQRKVSYAFGEVLVPLVLRSTDRTGLQELELSLSGRVEDYSDFGTATNPKVGLRYVPTDGLTLRGTWGKSYRAPRLYHLNVALFSTYQDAAALGGTPSDHVLFLSGGNKDLGPEKADTWTLGADWSPPTMRSLRISLTYFNVDYRGRTGIGPNFGTALSDPLFAPFVTKSPSVAQVNDLISRSADFQNLASAPFLPQNVNYIVDSRYTNITTQRTEGVDLSVDQNFALARSRIDIFGQVSWLRIKQQTLPTSTESQLTGTVFNAPNLRGRLGATWSSGGLSATGIVNYVDGAKDNVGVTPRKTAPWTTLDTTLSYDFQRKAGPLSGVRLVLSAINLLDKDPPLALSPAVSFVGMRFDSTNTSAIGRFVAFQVAKRF